MTLRFTTTAQGEIVTLAVSGPIDATNAVQFRRAIADALRQGTQLTIDLTAVDLLASPGVGILYDYADHHPQLVIRAGSVVARILAITALDEHLSVRAT
jgi:anti-sigma B factor antagonist